MKGSYSGTCVAAALDASIDVVMDLIQGEPVPVVGWLVMDAGVTMTGAGVVGWLVVGAGAGVTGADVVGELVPGADGTGGGMVGRLVVGADVTGAGVVGEPAPDP
jgi:hypothetical protein